MQRILIFGNSGSGKSTFSGKLGKKLNLPVYHMDEVCCDSDWKRFPAPILIPRIQKIIDSENWIIEGDYYSLLFAERVARADTIIILDLPVWICLYRVLKRFLLIELNKEKRIGIAVHQNNKLSLNFFYWIIWRYPRIIAKKIKSSLEGKKHIQVMRLKTMKEIHDFLQSLDTIS